MNLRKLVDLNRQINKPEYLFNPKQLLRRVLYRNKQQKDLNIYQGMEQPPFYVNESEVIGRSILTLGVYDLVVAETLTRALSPGDRFVDVGANIGYFSRLATRLGAQCTAFEPHPQLFARLEKNLPQGPNVTLINKAVSSEPGKMTLYIPKGWENNEGIASLEPTEDGVSINVQTTTLDLEKVDPIRLLKVDVEGHELEVFKGAQGLLENQHIELIVFEDFKKEKSDVIAFLQDKGMTVRGLKKTLRGPVLVPLDQLDELPPYEPPNFIAGWSLDFMEILFGKRGWQFYQ